MGKRTMNKGKGPKRKIKIKSKKGNLKKNKHTFNSNNIETGKKVGAEKYDKETEIENSEISNLLDL